VSRMPLRRLAPLGVGLALLAATAGAAAAHPSARAASAATAARERAHWIRDGLSAPKPGKHAHWIRNSARLAGPRR
jgi:hypothetical protein